MKQTTHKTQTTNKQKWNKPKQFMPTEFKFYDILCKASFKILSSYLQLPVLVVEDTVKLAVLIEMIVMLDWLFWFASLRETLNNWRGSNKGPPIWLDGRMIWHMKKDWRNRVYSA